MEPVEQALLQAAGTSQGKTGKHATVESKGDRGDSSKYGYAESAANPLLNPQPTLHGGEETATGEQSNRQRGRCSCRVAKQEYRGMGACALQGGSGKNETQDRPGAGCPEQSGANTQQEGVQDTCT